MATLAMALAPSVPHEGTAGRAVTCEESRMNPTPQTYSVHEIRVSLGAHDGIVSGRERPTSGQGVVYSFNPQGVVQDTAQEGTEVLPTGFPVDSRPVNPGPVASTGLPGALTTGQAAQGVGIANAQGVAIVAMAQEGTGVLPTGLPVVPRSVNPDSVGNDGASQSLRVCPLFPGQLTLIPWQ